jgi:hypothetical protein
MNNSLTSILFQLKHEENFNKINQILLAESLIKLKDYDSALLVLATLNSKIPFHSEVNYLQAKCYKLIGEDSLSLYYINKAIALNSEDKKLVNFKKNNFDSKEFLTSYLTDIDESELLINAKDYTNEKAVVLLNEKIEKINSDGSSLVRTRVKYYINNPDQAENLKNYQFVLNAKREELLAFSISVKHNEQSYTSSSTSKRSLSDPKSKLYYDIVLISADVPYFAKGALISIDYTIKSNEGIEYNGYFGSRSYFSQTYRILYGTIKTVTQNIDLTYKLSNISEKNLKITTRNNEKVYTINVENQPPKDYEQNSIPYFNRVPNITFSTHKNWKEFYNWYHSLLNDRTILTQQMKNDLKKILKNKKTKEEKIASIYEYITDRTRYVGFETGIGGLQPRSVLETYESQLGDCKDIALLLATLLKEAGIDAYLALVKTNSSGFTDKSIAFAGNFNHAICYVDYNGGIFLDGTVDNSTIYDLPMGDRNIESLIIMDDSYQFKEIEPEKYSKFDDEVETKVYINSNGSARLERKLIKKGLSAAYFRNTYKSDKEKIINLTKFWGSNYTGSTVSEYQIDNLKAKGPLQYSYKILIPEFLQMDQEYISYSPFLLNQKYTKIYTTTPYRETHLFFNSESISNNKTTYILPENLSLYSYPDNYKLKNDLYEQDTKFSILKNTISCEVTSKSDYGIIHPLKYQELRQSFLHLDRLNSNSIVLIKNEN